MELGPLCKCRDCLLVPANSAEKDAAMKQEEELPGRTPEAREPIRKFIAEHKGRRFILD
jgi:hypothetical protein